MRRGAVRVRMAYALRPMKAKVNIARNSPRELPTDASLARAHAPGFDAIALAGGRPGDVEHAAAGGLGVLHGKRQRVRLDPSDLPFAIWRLDNPGGRRYGQAP